MISTKEISLIFIGDIARHSPYMDDVTRKDYFEAIRPSTAVARYNRIITAYTDSFLWDLVDYWTEAVTSVLLSGVQDSHTFYRWTQSCGTVREQY